MAILAESDNNEKKPKGYIQSVGYNPFNVVMFTQEQLDIVKDYIKRKQGYLYLDATGSVIKKIHGQNAPYYYVVTLKHETKGEPPIPVAEMITTDHHTANVLYFLNLFRQHLSDLSVHNQPRKIEIDFSWEFIHSALMAFNRQDVNHYLATCWNICTGKLTAETHRITE